jgi:hypothetical protein
MLTQYLAQVTAEMTAVEGQLAKKTLPVVT